MKQRIITGIGMFIFVCPLVILGKYFFAFFVALLSILSTKEICDLKKNSSDAKLPIYVYIIAFLFGLLMIFDLPMFNNSFDYANGSLNSFNINIIYLVLFSLLMLSLTVFDKRVEIKDSMLIIGSIIFISLGLKGLLYLRTFNDKEGFILIIYVLLVTCFTDIFAYFGGMLSRKIFGEEKLHKLNERISPKKTIEGCIIGTIIATLASFLFAFFTFKGYESLNYKWYMLLLFSLILSITGQLGDLIFSSIKRSFGIKDYSNLLPGHGGILDRIDSLLINAMVLALLVSIL